jgi:hypothetical protein
MKFPVVYILSCVQAHVVKPRQALNSQFLTTPFANLTTFTAPSWTTLAIAQLTTEPFCENEADPDQGIGNHCVCKNGATIDIIPYTGHNLSDYQPCAYTTVDPKQSSATVTICPIITGDGYGGVPRA